METRRSASRCGVRHGASRGPSPVKAAGLCPSILVSEWLAHKLIRRYLEGFSEQTWPSVVKWTFILGVLSLRNSDVPLHSLSVDDLIDIVNQNGYCSLTPAQRLAPLQWAGPPECAFPGAAPVSTALPPQGRGSPGEYSAAELPAAAVSARAACGLSTKRKTVTFSQISPAARGGASREWLARKPSSDWRNGESSAFATPREASPTFPPKRSTPGAPEAYPSWGADWSPPLGGVAYSAAAFGASPLSHAAIASLGDPDEKENVSSRSDPRGAACGFDGESLDPRVSSSRGGEDRGLADASAPTPEFGRCARVGSGLRPLGACRLLSPRVSREGVSAAYSSKLGGRGALAEGARLPPRGLWVTPKAVISRAPRAACSLGVPTQRASPLRASALRRATPAAGARGSAGRLEGAAARGRWLGTAALLKQRNLHVSLPAASPRPPIDGFQAFRPAQEASWVCTLRPSSHKHLPPPAASSSRPPLAAESLSRRRERRARDADTERRAAAGLSWLGGSCAEDGQGDDALADGESDSPWTLGWGGYDEDEAASLAGGPERGEEAENRRGGTTRAAAPVGGAIAQAVRRARAAAVPSDTRAALRDEGGEDALLAKSAVLPCSYFQAAFAAYSETPGVRTPHRRGDAGPKKAACSWEIDVHGKAKPLQRGGFLSGSVRQKTDSQAPPASEPSAAFSVLHHPSLLEASSAISVSPPSPPALAGEAGGLYAEGSLLCERRASVGSETLSSLSLDRIPFSPSGRSPPRLTAADVSFANLPVRPRREESPRGAEETVGGAADGQRGSLAACKAIPGARQVPRDSELPLSASFVSSESSFRSERMAAEKGDGEGDDAASPALGEEDTLAIKDLLEMYWGDTERACAESGAKSEQETHAHFFEDETQEATCVGSTPALF
ncbi:hypothetical protein BESB_075100 [Besnoitia besnoiti]|uniref:Uncharacterized protein n=1 Tax=Besnoitia besnoiti TaxID=94643 RepID=A0A2A9M7B5_BESBE|nr:uncharacterized protein BESB_075100 [Besnoitia besnoiti]PFH34358.1 hypothetical protein BESB_075100 [Besnoitia besnoiti]